MMIKAKWHCGGGLNKRARRFAARSSPRHGGNIGTKTTKNKIRTAKRNAARKRARPLIRLGVALFYTARRTFVLCPDAADYYTVSALLVSFRFPFGFPLVTFSFPAQKRALL